MSTDDDARQSELRYRRLFEAAHDGILIVDPQTRKILDVNPFLAKFLGYAHEDFIGRELFEIGLLKDEAASQVAFEELLAKGRIRYDDLPLETRHGRRVEVEFVSNLYQEGDRQVIQCNIRDISARKFAEAELRQSEERFKLVARAVSDVIWDRNLVADTIWWSDGFMTTFGYAPGEVEPGSSSWSGRIHPGDADRVTASLRQCIDSGVEAWSAEYRFRCRNGTYALVHDSGFILRDASGRGLRVVGGMRDLTEQKRIEAQSLRAQRMESLGTLAGGIAHDLNNVLAPILMSIELLKLDSGPALDRGKILHTIQTSCQRGANLVRQVLSFARGVDGERITIRLRHLINDLKGMIRETFPRDITIECEVDRALWLVAGDPTQLHQVLLNLAVNARDAMPHGGTLRITASNLVLAAPFAGGSRFVVLTVSDTGEGIAPDIRERIFEPFFTTKDIGKGTGLGLATVHAIVKSHGGFVTVDSEIGSGTAFKVHLPADLAPEGIDVLPLLDAAIERGRDELVLVVDDEAAIRDVTQQTLEAFGYRVLTASDGAEAVALYAEHGPQIAVVLIDRMMPVMDGVVATQALRSMNPSVKIIAASGLEIPEKSVSHHRAGGPVFLTKPYTARTLVHLVREVIDQPAVASAL